VVYGNSSTDVHRWKFFYDGFVNPSAEPVDYVAPVGAVPSSVGPVDFLRYWWRNVAGFIPTAYSLSRAYMQSIDVVSGDVSPEVEEVGVGAGWVGLSTRDPLVTQPGGYHCVTLRSSDGRNNKFYVFGSQAAVYSRHTRDNTHTGDTLAILRSGNMVTSWKPSGAGRVSGNGLQQFNSASHYLSCGYNRRQRLHNIY
jgi:hypothetical protein